MKMLRGDEQQGENENPAHTGRWSGANQRRPHAVSPLFYYHAYSRRAQPFFPISLSLSLLFPSASLSLPLMMSLTLSPALPMSFSDQCPVSRTHNRNQLPLYWLSLSLFAPLFYSLPHPTATSFAYGDRSLIISSSLVSSPVDGWTAPYILRPAQHADQLSSTNDNSPPRIYEMLHLFVLFFNQKSFQQIPEVSSDSSGSHIPRFSRPRKSCRTSPNGKKHEQTQQ